MRGFSLIELSIVLVILGLIVGGIVGGRALVRQAQLQTILAEFSSLKTALNTFGMQYSALPGDFKEATTYWSGTSNGDGDGYIGATHMAIGGEVFLLWQHLGLADLLAGTYTGVSAASDPWWRPGLNIPVAKYGRDGSLFIGSMVVYNQGRAVTMQLSGTNGGGGQDGGILKPGEARSLDQKVDDGKADTGAFFAYNTTGSCTNASAFFFDGGTASYILSETQPYCGVMAR